MPQPPFQGAEVVNDEADAAGGQLKLRMLE
jgi:hypothetical protein